jgi:hypothetical protein
VTVPTKKDLDGEDLPKTTNVHAEGVGIQANKEIVIGSNHDSTTTADGFNFLVDQRTPAGKLDTSFGPYCTSRANGTDLKRVPIQI